MRVNIEAERGRLRMTKKQMCEELNITSKTYDRYINDKPIPSDILEKLHFLTGRSTDYLLGFDIDDRRIG